MIMERMNRKLNAFGAKLTPVDKATLIYIFLTGLIIPVGWGQIGHPLFHLGMRVLFVLIIVVLVNFGYKISGVTGIFLRNFYSLVFFSLFYTETAALNRVIFKHYFDPVISGIENSLFGNQPSLMFSIHFPQRWLAELMHFSYFSFYLIISGFCLYLWFYNRVAFQKGLFVICFSFYLYYLIFIFFPVAGPQFYFPSPENSIPGGYVFGWLMHLVHQLGERPTAAFPSSHVGISFLICFLSFRYARPLFFCFLFLFVLLCFSTVYLKAHYLIDVIGGLITAPLFGIFSLYAWRKL